MAYKFNTLKSSFLDSAFAPLLRISVDASIHDRDLGSVVALVVVFMLLFLALDSVFKAGLILATAPSAFIGGVASLLITR